MSQYAAAIAEAKKAVENEEEPYKSIAFEVILSKLLQLGSVTSVRPVPLAKEQARTIIKKKSNPPLTA